MKTNYFLLFITLIFFINTEAQKELSMNKNSLAYYSDINVNDKNYKDILFNAKRARTFEINSEILLLDNIQVGDQIIMPLFEDRVLSGFIESKSTGINGVSSLVIKFENYKYANAIISISDNSFLLQMDIPELNESYKTKFSKSSNTVYLLEQDINKIREDNCGLTNSENQHKTDTSSKNSAGNSLINPSETCLTLPLDTDLAQIDILIVYTDAAETWATNNDGNIQNTINSAIIQANQISSNNNLGINFNLVHNEKVTYTEVSGGADLQALSNSTDGLMDGIHDLRRFHNADLVCIFTYLPGDGIGGIANLLDTRYGNPDKAFSNVKVNNANSAYTFAHEISHNMGANHYRNQTDAPGPTDWIDWPSNDWSSGWRDQNGNDFRTIMTYSDGQSDPIIPYLSDPDIIHSSGDPIGNASTADNARTLLQMKHEVSRYSDAIQYCLAGEQRLVSQNVDYIASVSMGDINHNSSGSFYSDLSGLATCMIPGDTQNLTTVIVGASSSAYLAVWIDWNDNKIFDPSELEYHSVPGLSEHSVNITAPLGYSAGNKRMRIRYYKTSTGPIAGWIPGNLDPCGYFAVGEVEDYTILLGEGEPCNDFSIPQNLVVEENNSTNVKISWDPLSGIDYYDLEYRQLGDPSWTLVSNIIYPYYTINGLDANTEYELRVRSICGGAARAFSSLLNFTTAEYVYCDATSQDTQYETIERVIFNEIDNTSPDRSVIPPGYEDFTSISTSVNLNQEYPMEVTVSGLDINYHEIYVWIDFNYDGLFSETDEQFILEPNTNNPIIGNIAIPATAVLGETTMRIRLEYNRPGYGANLTPCGISSFGQVEDYTINIVAPPLSVNDLSISAFQIYPNPFTSNLSIFSKSSLDVIETKIYDISGKLVSTQTLNKSDSNFKLSNLEHLSGGMYFLEIKDLTSQGATIRKIIKD